MLLGNAIELVTEATGIKKVVDTISEKTGKDCGCASRKAKLNNPKLLINKILNKNGISKVTTEQRSSGS
jgi:hypothetical protein